MIYLKKFNESKDEVINYLKDICNEIEDMGFGVNIFGPFYSFMAFGKVRQHSEPVFRNKSLGNDDKSSIVIEISQNNRRSWWSNDDKVKNDEQFLYGSTMDHVENYMKGFGYKMSTNHNLSARSDSHYITYTFTKLS